MAKTSQELSSIGSVEVRGRLDFLKLFCKDLDSNNLASIVFCLADFIASALTGLRNIPFLTFVGHSPYILALCLSWRFLLQCKYQLSFHLGHDS
jgi:hypothetical protein